MFKNGELILMIGLILGTVEGKYIVSALNKFTDDLLISTATVYGGELLGKYKYKILNDKPLKIEELRALLKRNFVKLLIDASHPYALEITKNVLGVCTELNIEYLRYERSSSLEKFKSNPKIIEVEDYLALEELLKKVKGNILNTTGSRNIDKFMNFGLENRIIHRVLPTEKVIKECNELGVLVKDIIAMQGPVSKELNISLIKEYEVKAVILKDSGREGGTEEKLLACTTCDVFAFVIKRSNIKYKKVFNDIDELVEYIKKVKCNICYTEEVK